MNESIQSKGTVQVVLDCIKDNWRVLIATVLAFKVASFIILTPLLVAAQRFTIWWSGDAILADADFVHLFFEPVGATCGILVASIWLASLGLEQASLLAVLASRAAGNPLSPSAAIRFSIFKGPRILGITCILIATSFAVLIPFAIIAFLIYRSLLGEYDINFYLSENPPEFILAICLGAVLLTIAITLLLWMHTAWLFALPIGIFEDKNSWQALTASRQRLHGKRLRVLKWIVIWLVGSSLISLTLSTASGFTVRFFFPSDTNSLVSLATRVGVILIVIGSLSLLVNILASISFGSMMFGGYRILNPSTEIPRGIVGAESTFGINVKLTGFRISVILGIGLLIAAWIGLSSLKTIPIEDHAVIMAHRGASADAPENTLAAFRLAIEQGADWIEIDVQESADGQVIVMHDSDFMKQAGNPLKTWDAKEEDLAQIDIGSWFDSSFSDQRVTTLEDVLSLCSGKVGVNIELKYYGHDQQLEQRVVDLVEQAAMANEVKIMSLKRDGVLKVNELRPNWKSGLLLSVHAGNLKQLPFDFVAVNSRFASRDFVQKAHAAGKEVYVWTVNDAASMSQMLNRGVDGLLTDRPALAKQVLLERSKMNLTERILSELSIWLLGMDQEIISDEP